MQNKKRILSFCLMLILLCCFFTGQECKVEAAGNYEAFLIDEADLLSDHAEQDIRQRLQNCLDTGNTGVMIIDELFKMRQTEADTIQYVQERYREMYGNQSGTVFVIDMASRYIEVVNFEDRVDEISAYQSAAIADNVYRYAEEGDYYTCTYKAIDMISSILQGGNIPQTMRVISNVILAMILALILNFFVLKFVSRAPKAKGKAWVEAANVEVQMNPQEPVYTTRSVEYFEVGSITGIMKTPGFLGKLIHVIVLAFRILIVVASSGGGGSSSGGSSSSGGGSRSSGGRSSGGGHRF